MSALGSTAGVYKGPLSSHFAIVERFDSGGPLPLFEHVVVARAHLKGWLTGGSASLSHLLLDGSIARSASFTFNRVTA